MGDILSEILRQRHQSPCYFCLSCGLQMESLEAVIELYVSEAGFRLNWPPAMLWKGWNWLMMYFSDRLPPARRTRKSPAIRTCLLWLSAGDKAGRCGDFDRTCQTRLPLSNV